MIPGTLRTLKVYFVVVVPVVDRSFGAGAGSGEGRPPRAATTTAIPTKATAASARRIRRYNEVDQGLLVRRP